jgi:two-component system response regulator
MVENGVDILLVEDNPSDEKVIVNGFRKCNIAGNVHVVRDGTEALEYLFCTGAYADRSSENPRLILLDMKLPQIDGLEVLTKIREEPRTRWIPVVALTSSVDERDIFQSYNLRVNSYVVKPAGVEQFNEVVRHLKYYWLLLNRQPGSVHRSPPVTASEFVSAAP